MPDTSTSPAGPKVGAHVHSDDPVTAAGEVGAQVVQFFVGDPQGWKTPADHPYGDSLRAAAAAGELELYVHSPYPINLASTNNRIRIPSRKLVADQAKVAARVGAKGLIVHGGHVVAGEDPAVGVDNWRKFFARAGDLPVPVLIENTAGGDNAMARRFDRLARLWDAVAEYRVGFCLDTCHAHAAGEDLVDVVDRVLAITGRIDLVHCNDSRDPFGSGRDRHTNLGSGEIGREALAAVVAAAGAPVVCETPTEGQREDIGYLRAALVR
jgi:deoxyribonuclease-4